MSNILLTGATGFIGSNILKEIRLDNKVFIIQRVVSKKKIKKNKNIKIITFEDYNTLSKKLKKIKVDTITNDMKDSCFINVATNSKDPSICERLSGEVTSIEKCEIIVGLG